MILAHPLLQTRESTYTITLLSILQIDIYYARISNSYTLFHTCPKMIFSLVASGRCFFSAAYFGPGTRTVEGPKFAVSEAMDGVADIR